MSCEYINSQGVRCPTKKLFFEQNGKKLCKKHYNLKAVQRNLSKQQDIRCDNIQQINNNNYKSSLLSLEDLENECEGYINGDENNNRNDIILQGSNTDDNFDPKEFLTGILRKAPEKKEFTKKQEKINEIVNEVKNDIENAPEKKDPGAFSMMLESAYWSMIYRIENTDESMKGLTSDIKDNKLIAPNVLLACHSLLEKVGIQDTYDPATSVFIGTISIILMKYITYIPEETLKNNIGSITIKAKEQCKTINIPGDNFNDL